MVPARRFIAEYFAPHDKTTGAQTGTFASDVASGLGSQNQYDPDRAAFQQMLAQQLGGPGAQTGSQQGNTGYGTGPGQDPYNPGPGINPNLGTFGPGGQPGTATPPPGGTPPVSGQGAGAGGLSTTSGGEGHNPIAFGAQQVPPGGVTPQDPRGAVTPPTGGQGGTQTVPPGQTVGATGTGLGGQRDATGGLVFSGLSQMLADPNIPQATKDAIQQQGALTARAGYAGASEGVLRNAAATGNTGGTAAGLSQLGRSQAGTIGDLNRQNNIAFEQEAQRRKETALSGLSNQYGQLSSNFNTLAGMRGALAGAPVGSQTGARNLTRGQQTGNTSGTAVNWI